MPSCVRRYRKFNSDVLINTMVGAIGRSGYILGIVTAAGSGSSSTPFGYLALGFGVILLLFVLANSDRRLREYLSRSLVRPYNFFADVRDQRIIPNLQTILLALIEAGAVGMYFAGMWLVFAPGARIISFAPLESLGLLGSDIWVGFARFGIYSGVAILLLTLLLRFAAIFVRGRIWMRDTFNIVVWSLVPLCFLLPLDLILPRLDPVNATFVFSLVVLAGIGLWVYQRLLKGAAVLLDVYPTIAYLYGSVLLAVVVLGSAIYLV